MHVPEPRDPEHTRGLILDSAQAVFAERGFAGTALRDIALRASVHQSLIHHHFGTKQKLWRRVMDRYAERYLERQIPSLTQGDPDATVLASALSTDFRFWQQHPQFLRLELWAALEGGSPLQDAQAALYTPFIRLVTDLQRRGIVRADVQPMHLITLAASAVTFWFQKRAEICTIVGADPESSVADDNYLSDVIKILFFGGAAP